MNTVLLRTIGASFIVAGTSIGAGMLALPLASAKLGFYPAIILLGGIWFFMLLSALLTLEVTMRYGEAATIPLICEKVFGRVGSLISTIALCVLFYALLSAYIAGGSATLEKLVEGPFLSKTSANYETYGLSYYQWQILFTFLFAFVLFFKTKGLDYVNRLLLIVKIVVFVLFINILMALINPEYLTHVNLSFSLESPLMLAIPVFFTSFGFHGSIPPLIRYIGPHPQHIKYAFIGGSLLPLIVYLIWELATLGTVPIFGEGGYQNIIGQKNELGLFVQHLTNISDDKSFSLYIRIFSFFAIATSFLGVSIGLYDFLKEWLMTRKTRHVHIFSLFLTFALPLGIAMSLPDLFVKALAFAAICLSILGVVMPALLALRMRRTHGFSDSQDNAHNSYVLKGGKGMIYVVLVFGLFVIGIEALNLIF